MTRIIFVTGGVVSSVGKGVTVASIGRILKSRGVSVSLMKLDPYLNVDPGTMSPYQHGEVFVTEDGSETDLDLGHYERFVDVNLTKLSNITAGQIYSDVIARERRGEFLGGTIQAVPHVTDAIKQRILDLAADSDAEVVVVEVGGTVGDIEGLPFLEAIRQMRNEVGRDNVLYIHVTFLPFISSTGELKTKPTQHSVRELRGIGIQPDAIVCRSDHDVDDAIKRKISSPLRRARRGGPDAADRLQHLRGAPDSPGRGLGRLYRRHPGPAPHRDGSRRLARHGRRHRRAQTNTVHCHRRQVRRPTRLLHIR